MLFMMKPDNNNVRDKDLKALGVDAGMFYNPVHAKQDGAQQDTKAHFQASAKNKKENRGERCSSACDIFFSDPLQG